MIKIDKCKPNSEKFCPERYVSNLKIHFGVVVLAENLDPNKSDYKKKLFIIITETRLGINPRLQACQSNIKIYIEKNNNI